MTKKALAALVALAMMAAIFLPACSSAKKTFSGYLICQKCGALGQCEMSDADLTLHPERYTLKCAKMTDCIVSGYGIAIKQKDGKYQFYPFDSKGSIMALDTIVYKTKRADNLLVEVTGTLSGIGGNVIQVESIAEK